MGPFLGGPPEQSRQLWIHGVRATELLLIGISKRVFQLPGGGSGYSTYMVNLLLVREACS